MGETKPTNISQGAQQYRDWTLTEPPTNFSTHPHFGTQTHLFFFQWETDHLTVDTLKISVFFFNMYRLVI